MTIRSLVGVFVLSPVSGNRVRGVMTREVRQVQSQVE